MDYYHTNNLNLLKEIEQENDFLRDYSTKKQPRMSLNANSRFSIVPVEDDVSVSDHREDMMRKLSNILENAIDSVDDDNGGENGGRKYNQYFTIAAKNHNSIHYSVHVKDDETKPDFGRKMSNTSNKLLNVKGSIDYADVIDEDDGEDNKQQSICIPSKAQLGKRVSVFEVFHGSKNDKVTLSPTDFKPISIEKPTVNVKPIDELTTQVFSQKMGDSSGDCTKTLPNRPIRFSISKKVATDNKDFDQQSVISLQKYKNKARGLKTLHPEVAFSSSKEVNRARKLCISPSPWNSHHTHNRHLHPPRDTSMSPRQYSITESDLRQGIANKFSTLNSPVNIRTSLDSIDAYSNHAAFTVQLQPQSQSHADHGKGHEGYLAISIISIMYGLLVSVIGITACITSVVTDKIHRSVSDFREAWFAFLYIGSIIWMVLCIFDINLYKKVEKKVKEIAEEKEDTRLEKDQYDSITKFCQKYELILKLKKIKNDFSNKLINTLQLSSNYRQSIDQEELNGYFYDYKYGAGGLYLKVGVGVFCIVSLIYSAIGITESLSRENECIHKTQIINQIFFFSFQFLQFVFIFKHSNIIIHNYKIVAKLAVMHVVVTNLCIWFSTIVIETEEQYLHSYENHHRKRAIKDDERHRIFASNCSIYEESNVRELQILLAPYLYPCTIEYSITSLTIFFIIWKNIGRKSSEFGYIIKTREMESVFHVDCQKSSRGLFVGIIVLLSTIVSNIIFFIYVSDTDARSQDLSIIITGVTELFLVTISLILIVYTFIRIKRLHIIEHGSMLFDEALVILSLIGIYLFCVFSVIAIVYLNREPDTIAHLTLAISIISIIEGTFLTSLILNALRRRAIDPIDQKYKPGRELITLLIMVNLSIWINETFSFRKYDATPLQLKYYSILTWSIITTISTPLAIFYRFHASVCLSDCWRSIYLD